MGPTGQQFPLKRMAGTVRQLGRVLLIFGDQGVYRRADLGLAPYSSDTLFKRESRTEAAKLQQPLCQRLVD
jgi:hypothetical protein